MKSDKDDLGFYRGLINAIPPSTLLWIVLIYGAVKLAMWFRGLHI